MDSHDLKNASVTGKIEYAQKKDKADFEAITHFGDSLYVFGSIPNREKDKMIQVNSSDVTNDSQRFACNHANFRHKPEDFNLEALSISKVVFIESRQRKFNKMSFTGRKN
jgi:hypothetical protein